MKIYVVNVFSERGLAGGNQLGVVPDASALTTAQMQLIARQMNYSESTFITEQEEKSCRFRIFLPKGEIGFAGHPTIGTSWLIEKLWRQKHEPREKLISDLKDGKVTTYYDEELDLTYMDQLPVKRHQDFDDMDALLEVLGVDKDDVRSSFLPVFSPSSLHFVFVPLQSPELVEALSPDFMGMMDLFEDQDFAPYVFAPGGVDDGDYHARMFAPTSGVNEDPATGSAQASFVHALRTLGLLDDPLDIVVEQGYEMGRPSKLYNRLVYKDGGNIASIRTGGRCHLALEGNLSL